LQPPDQRKAAPFRVVGAGQRKSCVATAAPRRFFANRKDAAFHAIPDVYFLAEMGEPVQSDMGVAVTIWGVVVTIHGRRSRNAIVGTGCDLALKTAMNGIVPRPRKTVRVTLLGSAIGALALGLGGAACTRAPAPPPQSSARI